MRAFAATTTTTKKQTAMLRKVCTRTGRDSGWIHTSMLYEVPIVSQKTVLVEALPQKLHLDMSAQQDT